MNLDARLIQLVSSVVLLGALTGCAGPRERPTALASPLNGQYLTGKVVSVREIDAGGQAGTVQQILAALQSPGAAAPSGQAEVIIRKADGNVTSLIQPAGRFVPGERVAIVEAATTVLRPD